MFPNCLHNLLTTLWASSIVVTSLIFSTAPWQYKLYSELYAFEVCSVGSTQIPRWYICSKISPAQYCAVHCSAVQCSSENVLTLSCVVGHRLAQLNAVQCSAVQCRPVQSSAVESGAVGTRWYKRPMNQWMIDKGVCRTAPATLGLLNMF